MPNAVREKEMNVGIEALRKTILDFENYPKFLSEVVSAKTRPGGTPQKTVVDFEIEVIKRFAYALEFHFADANEIRWKLLEGKLFTKNEGRWKLDARGDKTHALYEVDVQLTLLVPGWVTRKLTENNLPRLLDSYEAQARKV